MPTRRAALSATAALGAALLVGCSSGSGPVPWGAPVGAGEVAQVDVSVPEAGAPRGLHDVYEVDVAADGSVVAALYSGSGSGVVRVVGDRPVSSVALPGRVVEVVPLPDGSVVVVVAEEEGTRLSVGVLPEGADAVDLRPLEPRVDLDEGEYAYGSVLQGVLAPDGETVVLALPDGDDAQLLVAVDPATGEVRAEQEHEATSVQGLHLDADREELVVLLGTAGGAEVHRLPADLSGADPEPVALDDPVWASALDDGGVLTVVALEHVDDDEIQVRYDAATVATLAPDADEADVRRVEVPGWPELPQGDVDAFGVDPEATTLYVAGDYGEDTDNPQPVLVVVDLGSGAAEAVDLSSWGFPNDLVVAEDVVVTGGGTRLGGEGAAAAAVWLYGRG
ncbi:hypothetical protein [Blastococcus sp. SYSU D00813]